MNLKPEPHLVLVCPKELDTDEAKRILEALKKATGEAPRPICPTGSAMIFVVAGEYKAIARAMDLATAMTTQYFISQLSEPWSTRGFAPTAGLMKKHLSQK